LGRIVNIHTTSVYDVYIGRGSKWGNPFVLGYDGTREQVIAKYEIYIRRTKSLMDALPELVGKVLGCYCYPLPCHGDVLLKLLKEQDTMLGIKR